MSSQLLQAQETDSVSVKSNIRQIEKVVPELRIPPKEKIKKYQADKHFDYRESRPVEYPEWVLKIMDWFGSLFDKSLSVVFTKAFWITIFVVLLTFLIIAIVLRMQGVTLRNLLGRRKIDTEESEFYSEDVNTMDFDNLISESVKTKNYRLAVRFLYLKNLKALSDRLIINWSPNKTNYSYLYEINSENLRSDFVESTRIFDFVWYGEFQLDESSFNDAHNVFNEFNRRINEG